MIAFRVSAIRGLISYRRSNIVDRRRVFRWEWDVVRVALEMVPTSVGMLGSGNLRHCRATEKQYNRAITFLLRKQITGWDPGGVAWYELMKIICSMGLKVT